MLETHNPVTCRAFDDKDTPAAYDPRPEGHQEDEVGDIEECLLDYTTMTMR